MTAYSPSEIAGLQAFYRKTLLDDVIPFWMTYGVDHVHGGFITSTGASSIPATPSRQPGLSSMKRACAGTRPGKGSA
jgi:mannose/cellobiose epimerase-like protein (N-acyl-D-glucosamine 2-epimerase family)